MVVITVSSSEMVLAVYLSACLMFLQVKCINARLKNEGSYIETEKKLEIIIFQA